MGHRDQEAAPMSLDPLLTHFPSPLQGLGTHFIPMHAKEPFSLLPLPLWVSGPRDPLPLWVLGTPSTPPCECRAPPQIPTPVNSWAWECVTAWREAPVCLACQSEPLPVPGPGTVTPIRQWHWGVELSCSAEGPLAADRSLPQWLGSDLSWLPAPVAHLCDKTDGLWMGVLLKYYSLLMLLDLFPVTPSHPCIWLHFWK